MLLQNDESQEGTPGKDERLVIGTMIIKHKLTLSDEKTISDDCQEQETEPESSSSWAL
jgi:hypothetical protein